MKISDNDMVHPNHVKSLGQKVTELCLLGNRNTSLVSQSIIASSLPRTVGKILLTNVYNSLDDDSRSGISNMRKLMGKEKFASLRKTYNILRNGLEIPKQNYTFLIDAHKVPIAISYLQESLNVKPGRTHNVCVA